MATSDTKPMKRGRPSLKEAQKKLREDAILDATYDLLMTKGYASMTLDDVIEAVGIAKATLYQHFSSKEELAAHVVGRKMTEVKAFLTSLDRTRPAGERMAEFISWMMALRYEGPGIRLCDFVHYLRPMNGGCSIVGELENEVTAEIEALVAEGQQEGSLRPDIPTIVLAQTLISAVRDDGYEPLIRSGRIQYSEIAEGVLRIMQNR